MSLIQFLEWRTFTRRHVLKMTAVWLLLLSTGACFIGSTPNVYRAEGKLYVRLGRENVTLDPTTNLGQGPITAVPQTRDTEMNSVVEILKSRVLLEQVVDQISPARILADQASWREKMLPSKGSPHENAVRKLGKMFTMASLRKSNLVVVSCDARNPELAKEATEVFIQRFLDYHRSLNRNPQARTFFHEQTELLGDKLRRCEADILALKNQAGVVSIDSQKELLLQQADALTQELRSAETEIDETEAAVFVLRRQLLTLPPTLVSSSLSGAANLAADNIRDRYFALQLQEQELTARFTATHPLVRQVRDQLQGAKGIYDREQGTRTQVTEGRNKGFEQTELSLLTKEAELEALKARVAAREPQLNLVQAQLADLNRTENKLKQSERELELLRESYVKYSQSLEQTRIDASLETDRITNINVVEPPIASRRAISPDRPLLGGLLFVFASFAAVGFGLAAEVGGGTLLPPRRTFAPAATTAEVFS